MGRLFNKAEDLDGGNVTIDDDDPGYGTAANENSLVETSANGSTKKRSKKGGRGS